MRRNPSYTFKHGILAPLAYAEQAVGADDEEGPGISSLTTHLKCLALQAGLAPPFPSQDFLVKLELPPSQLPGTALLGDWSSW